VTAVLAVPLEVALECMAVVVAMTWKVVVVKVLNDIRSGSSSGVGSDRCNGSQVFALAPEVAVALLLVLAEPTEQ